MRVQTKYTHTTENKQIWEWVGVLKKGRSLRAHSPCDLPIPLLRELREERWATDCWAGLHQHFTTLPSVRGSGCSEALSALHKEKGKVKEDYKKSGGCLKGRRKKTSGRAFCVWHSGQRQAGFCQWEDISTPTRPLHSTLFAVVASHRKQDCFTPHWQRAPETFGVKYTGCYMRKEELVIFGCWGGKKSFCDFFFFFKDLIVCIWEKKKQARTVLDVFHMHSISAFTSTVKSSNSCSSSRSFNWDCKSGLQWDYWPHPNKQTWERNWVLDQSAANSAMIGGHMPP